MYNLMTRPATASEQARYREDARVRAEVRELAAIVVACLPETRPGNLIPAVKALRDAHGDRLALGAYAQAIRNALDLAA